MTLWSLPRSTIDHALNDMGYDNDGSYHPERDLEHISPAPIANYDACCDDIATTLLEQGRRCSIDLLLAVVRTECPVCLIDDPMWLPYRIMPRVEPGRKRTRRRKAVPGHLVHWYHCDSCGADHVLRV
jgi:hypothetical protein